MARLFKTHYSQSGTLPFRLPLRFGPSENNRFQWLCLLLTFITLPVLAQDQNGAGPYQLSWKTDASLVGIGLATGVSALILDNHATPVTLAEINGLDRSRVSVFDRSATFRNAPNAAYISDQTLNAGFILGGIVAVPAALKARQDWVVVPVMFLETVAVATTIQQTVKNVFPRYRPFDYNPDVPLSEKLTNNGHQSFFSGHAGTSFATAVFTSELFRHYFPHSRLKPVVWVVTLGLASTTSLMRYEAGRHFPSDILVGAAFGSFVGWAVPKLHERKTNPTALMHRLTVQPWSNGQANGLFIRASL